MQCLSRAIWLKHVFKNIFSLNAAYNERPQPTFLSSQFRKVLFCELQQGGLLLLKWLLQQLRPNFRQLPFESSLPSEPCVLHNIEEDTVSWKEQKAVMTKVNLANYAMARNIVQNKRHSAIAKVL